jgi:cobalamin biosynthesis protein CobD/CbiB
MCEKNNKAYLGLYLAWLTVTLSHVTRHKKSLSRCHTSQKNVVTGKKTLSHIVTRDTSVSA